MISSVKISLYCFRFWSDFALFKILFSLYKSASNKIISTLLVTDIILKHTFIKMKLLLVTFFLKQFYVSANEIFLSNLNFIHIERLFRFISQYFYQMFLNLCISRSWKSTLKTLISFHLCSERWLNVSNMCQNMKGNLKYLCKYKKNLFLLWLEVRDWVYLITDPTI